jgi:putative membrane protein
MIIIPKINKFLPNFLPGLLILTSSFLISKEKTKLKAILIFSLTGILGYFTLNILPVNQPLLPMLSGLFGSSMLVLSIKNKTEIPKQENTKPKVKILKPLLGSLIASPICSFLPGLGSGQAAIIGNTISKTDKKGFLVLLGATNTLVMSFSFLTLYLISKTRTGAANAIKEIVGQLHPNILILILIIILISGIISFFLTKNIAKIFAQKIHKINYTKISIITLIFLSIIILIFSNLLGLIIFIISTFLGILCVSLKVRKTNLMGCLLIPTILFYLF